MPIKIPEFRYSFDRVEYSCIHDVAEIKPITQSKAFSDLFSGKIVVVKATDVRRFMYKSFIGGRPKYGIPFFCEMDIEAKKIGGTLTYTEVAKDRYYPDEASAIAAYTEIERDIYLKYGGDNCRILEFSEPLRDGFFYNRELCLGRSRKFEMAIYPRYCKITGRPVLRKEFRGSGHRRILSLFLVSHERFIASPKIYHLLLARKYLDYGELNEKRIENLLSLRSAYVDIPDIFTFRQFRKNEREGDLSGEGERYIKRLNRPLSYYLA